MFVEASYGTGHMAALFASVGHGDVHALFLVLAVLFVLGALYLALALQNYIGAVVCVVLAILVVLFLA